MFSWKPAILKAVRGGLFAAALLVVYDPNISSIAAALPEQYRTQAAFILAVALPALRNTLKNRFLITFGGLL